MSKLAGRARIGRHVVATVAECWALAEVVYYYTHDGEETLHGVLCDYLRALAEKIRTRTSIRETLDMIRSLPEQDQDD